MSKMCVADDLNNKESCVVVQKENRVRRTRKWRKCKGQIDSTRRI